MGTEKDRSGTREVRRIAEMVSTGSLPGNFVDMTGDIMQSPAVQRIASSTKMNAEDILEEIAIRGEMRRYLADVASSEGDEFLGPKWIVFANDYLAQQLSAGIWDKDTILEGFRRRFLTVSGLE